MCSRTILPWNCTWCGKFSDIFTTLSVDALNFPVCKPSQSQSQQVDTKHQTLWYECIIFSLFSRMVLISRIYFAQGMMIWSYRICMSFAGLVAVKPKAYVGCTLGWGSLEHHWKERPRWLSIGLRIISTALNIIWHSTAIQVCIRGVNSRNRNRSPAVQRIGYTIMVLWSKMA